MPKILEQTTHLAELPTPCSDSFLAEALASVANAVFITDCEGRVVWANQSFSQLSGYAQEEIIGRTPSLLKSGIQGESFYAGMWRAVLAGNTWRGMLVDRRKDGTFYTVDETITPLKDAQGKITHFVAVQLDVTARAKQSERDRYLAYHDVLTGLPNRLQFLDLQERAFASARSKGRLVALLFMDLDNFKPVNDSFGHYIGDRLLLAVANRLTAAIRKSDTVARFGGDEFAILLADLPDEKVIGTLARKLARTIARPFMIETHRIEVRASIGISVYPNDGEEPEALMEKADQAMYLAKKEGGNGFHFQARKPQR